MLYVVNNHSTLTGSFLFSLDHFCFFAHYKKKKTSLPVSDELEYLDEELAESFSSHSAL